MTPVLRIAIGWLTLCSFGVSNLTPRTTAAMPRRAGPDSARAVAAAPSPASPAVEEPESDAQSGSSGRPAATDLEIAIPGASSPRVSALQIASGGPSGGSSQEVSLPGGGGTAAGLGESFSAQLTTGQFSYSVPIALPPARAGVQAQLALTYASGSGSGNAGRGWSLGVPAISRQTDHGIPNYDDPGVDNTWHPEQDRFLFGPGNELVPICTVRGGLCAGALADEQMPVWAEGWQYFRSRVATFQRVFWSPDHRSWRVQTKSGRQLELGVPLDGSNYEGGLEANPLKPKEIYRWYVTREYDAHGDVHTDHPRPFNQVVYRYEASGNMAWLSDIYDTSPASDPASADTSLFANHVRLVYAGRSDPGTNYRSGFLQIYDRRLARVDISSKPFATGPQSPRELVRRYHMGYEANAHASLLTSLAVEGRCDSPVTELADEALPGTNCPRLPSMRFCYSGVARNCEGTDGSGPEDQLGKKFEAFSTELKQLANSPPQALSHPDVGILDVNRDGLADVMVTIAARAFGFQPRVFLNGHGNGTPGFAAHQPMVVDGFGFDSQTLQFSSRRTMGFDADADGAVDLLYLPPAFRFRGTYFAFAPEVAPTGALTWKGSRLQWQGQLIDFDSAQVRSIDVNGDGLVDIVRSHPNNFATYFALGRYPGGHQRFGNASWTGPDSATLDEAPVRTCGVPATNGTHSLAEADLHAADINGDGLVDFAQITPRGVAYWPGRGNGFWGTGARDDCRPGVLADRAIYMANAPQLPFTSSGRTALADLNADGLSDLAIARRGRVEVYLNDGGRAWTDARLVTGMPIAFDSFAVADIDGNGTPDFVWGESQKYQYLDLTAGARPLSLTQVENGLGKTVELEYEDSTAHRARALARGESWSTTMPLSVSLLRRMTVVDNLDQLGRPLGRHVTEYRYRDPLFETRTREFRGFEETKTIVQGGTPEDSTVTRSVFNLGRCRPDVTPGVPEACTPGEQWRDSPLDALRGTPRLVEVSSAGGAYLSTAHFGYELRQLYQGLDGRSVNAALPVYSHEFAYETTGQASMTSSVTRSLPNLCLRGDCKLEEDFEPLDVAVRVPEGFSLVATEMGFDDFGNATSRTDLGCVEGCLSSPDEVITTTSLFERPPGDGSGWLWTAFANSERGSAHPTRVTANRTIYNSVGDSTRRFATLSGTVALDRFHADESAKVAPEPPEASGGVESPLEVELLTSIPDPFGNVLLQQGASGRCRQTQYDTQYATLPVSSIVHAGDTDAGLQGPRGPCGTTLLVEGREYDRGLGVVKVASDERGQPYAFGYDAFGRLVSETGPDPDRPGQLAPLPSKTVQYFPTRNPNTRPYSRIVTRMQDGQTVAEDEYLETHSFVDGLGRALVVMSEADPAVNGEMTRTPSGGFGWVASGVADFDAKGQVVRQYEPWYTNDNPAEADLTDVLAAALPVSFMSRAVDPFGRTTDRYDWDGTRVAHFEYHAASIDLHDASDLAPGPAFQTFSTTHTDGHGRAILTITRTREGDDGPIQEIKDRREYLPSGQVERIVNRIDSGPPIERWLRYDTLGRMVLNVEPNTTPDFTPDTTTPAEQLRAWKYAYNDAGDLVGTTDARGCGANYHYDAAGRIRALDYSPCETSHEPYSAVDLSSGQGAEAFFEYDRAGPGSHNAKLTDGGSFSVDEAMLLGRLATISERGRQTALAYDARGRLAGQARRLAKPSTRQQSGPSERYSNRWYVQRNAYDGADRLTTMTTGNPLPELAGPSGQSAVSFQYSRRGVVHSTASSYGPLLVAKRLLANGQPESEVYGDAASTQRAYGYDDRQRLQSVMTFRAAAPLWSSAAPNDVEGAPSDTTQLILEDTTFAYDEVGALTAALDHRSGDLWPEGAKPTDRHFQTDPLLRLRKVTYEHGGDRWKSPYAPELAVASRGAKPVPHVDFAQRVAEQTYEYDYRGNLRLTTDDAEAFFDRSLGETTLGEPEHGPDQLRSASNRARPGTGRGGELNADHDAAGNLTTLVVKRDGPCLPAQASCWQRFEYDWDEVGNLASARRWDLAGNERELHATPLDEAPNRAPDVRLDYEYGIANQRVLKHATAESGERRHTAYVYPSLELRSTEWEAAAERYRVEADVVALNLGSSARLAYFQDKVEAVSEASPRLVLRLNDHLGSGTISLDHATGELIQRRSYLAYGQLDSDYRPDRWGEYRDPYEFTGKEADIEVGLHYFGARYYSAHLGRWLSADPASIHRLASELNPYSYVNGFVFDAVDPDGEFLVALVITVVIAATLSASVNVLSQAQAAEWDFSAVKWGWGNGAGMLAAGTTGALAAGAGVLAGPAVGLYVAGAVSGGLSAGFRGEGVSGIVGGAMIGTVLSAAGGSGAALAQKLGGGGTWQAIAAGATGTAASMGLTVATGNSISSGDAMWSLGLSVAGATAGYKAGQAAHRAYRERSRLGEAQSDAPPRRKLRRRTDGAGDRAAERARQIEGDSSSGAAGAGGKPLYRSMSQAEANAVEQTGRLRGGRPGDTYWTDSRFRSADRVQDRLSLPNRPDVQMEFRLKSSPTMVRDGTRVAPDYGGRGGGREYMSTDPVEVDIVNVQPYR